MACFKRDIGDILALSGDGTGIRDMTRAVTMAGSSKGARWADEIGRFGQALLFATWHLADDCLHMTVYVSVMAFVLEHALAPTEEISSIKQLACHEIARNMCFC